MDRVHHVLTGQLSLKLCDIHTHLACQNTSGSHRNEILVLIPNIIRDHYASLRDHKIVFTSLMLKVIGKHL